MADSLNRIRANGRRALAMVERMRGLGVVGGDLTPVDLNSTVHSALEVGASAFLAQWPEFKLSVEYELDPSAGEVQIMGGLQSGRGELGVQCLLRYVVKAVRRRRGRVPAKATGLYRGRRRHDRAEGSGQRHGHIRKMCWGTYSIPFSLLGREHWARALVCLSPQT